MYFFILGTERSGTSLLRKILGNHSKITIPPNDGDIFGYYKRFSSKKLSKMEKREIVNEIKREKPKLKEWKLNWREIEKEALKEKYDSIGDIIGIIWENFWKKSDAPIKALKTPYIELHYDLILKLYPDAYFISILRDPRAVYVSRKHYKKIKKKLGFRDTFAFKNLLAVYKWVESRKAVRQIREKVGERRLGVIRYEELVKNPQENIQRVCNLLDIEFEEKMLELKGSDVGSSSFEQRKNKPEIYKSSIDKWREKISKPEIKLIEKYSGEFMDRLGYKRVSPILNFKEKLEFYLLSFAFNLTVAARIFKEKCRHITRLYKRIINHET